MQGRPRLVPLPPLLKSLAVPGLASIARAEPVTIRYVCGAGGDNLKLLNAQTRQFEREHPNIRIKVEPVVAGLNANRLVALARRTRSSSGGSSSQTADRCSASLQQARKMGFHLRMAGSMIVLLPIFVIFFSRRGHFVRGITLTEGK